MADEIKYLGQLAVEQLVTEIKAADAKALQAAKDYADGLADNYDAAGTAATKVQELADGQVKTNTEAIAAINDAENGLLKQAKDYADSKVEGVDLSGIAANAEAIEGLQSAIDGINNADTGLLKQAKDYADGKAAEVQGEVDALEALVGTLPEGTEATSVVAYVDAKTTGIASSDNLDALGERVTQAEADIDAIEADYLKAADKTELSNAIGAEKSRAEGIEAGLRSDVDVIKGDYLKAADKTELSNAIAAEKERAEGVEAGLQTQINTIMNNPDTEGVINSINEFTQYISDHGEVAEGFRTDIDANKKAVEDLAAYVGEIPSSVNLFPRTVVTPEESPYTPGVFAFPSIALNEPLMVGQTYRVVIDYTDYDCVAEPYGPITTRLIVGGTGVDDCVAIISHQVDHTDTTISVGSLDPTKGHAFEIWIDGSDAESVVEYIDEKFDSVDGLVQSHDNWLNYLDEISHEHKNADVLNGITADKVAAWDAASGDAADALAGVKSELEGKIADGDKANKDLIDALDGRVGTAESDIDALEASLAEGGATANAIADAKKAGTDAQGMVTAHETAVNEALAGKADKATTLEGYGITDAYNKGEVDQMLSNATTIMQGIESDVEALKAVTHTEITAAEITAMFAS